MKEYEVKVDFSIVLTQEDIDDLMVTSLEGGVTACWCSECEVVGDYLGEYASEQISRGGSLIFHDAESDDKWELTLEKLLNGVKLWYESGYDRYGAVQPNGKINFCNIDAVIADMIVQFALFGELVFG